MGKWQGAATRQGARSGGWRRSKRRAEGKGEEQRGRAEEGNEKGAPQDKLASTRREGQARNQQKKQGNNMTGKHKRASEERARKGMREGQRRRKGGQEDRESGGEGRG